MIVGKTGSGKTFAGIWNLSYRNWTKRPWVIFDFKQDDLINSIPNTRLIGLNDTPKYPGLYIVRPLPNQHDLVEQFLWRVWKKEGVGLYIDEGYMIDKGSEAFAAILTQGRSKRIPVIILTQRPVFLNKFVFTEAEYIQAFWLNWREDRKKVGEYVPAGIDVRLPDYHSFWYEVNQDRLTVFEPVPDQDEIIEIFKRQAQTLRKVV